MKISSIGFLIVIAASTMAVIGSSCKKQNDFLAKTPDIALTTPTTMDDLKLILQNNNTFNITDPGLGLVSVEPFVISDAYFQSLDANSQNEYVWVKDVYPNSSVADWDNCYNQIRSANIVLTALDGIKTNEIETANNLRGIALFFRGRAFYNLLQIFSLPYDSISAATDLGIPIRLNTNIENISMRASLKDSYDQVLKDLQSAESLLSQSQPVVTLPSKAAADAMLARVYLSMSNYTEALKYANSCLSIRNQITDFNTLNISTRPISRTTLSEEIFRAVMNNYPVTSPAQRMVDTSFYNSYDSNDLRRQAFFYKLGGRLVFFGSYDVQKIQNFSGLATDEIYFIRAECNARNGNFPLAMNDLNNVLKNRWKTGTFTPLSAIDSDDALVQILRERKKELVFRGLAWTDLRRLNKEPRFATTISRIVNGKSYELLPNDPKYVLPIPDNEIKLSGIQQNPR